LERALNTNECWRRNENPQLDDWKIYPFGFSNMFWTGKQFGTFVDVRVVPFYTIIVGL
jgi:hypothetical protein